MQDLPNETVCVVGGGLAGLTAALALSKKGFEVDLIAPVIEPKDGRTTALLDQSVRFLSGLGVWERVEGRVFPLRTMRIVDATDRLIRAPQVDFRSSEIDLDAFGYNAENRVLVAALEELIAQEDSVTRHNALVESVVADPKGGVALLGLSNGERVKASLFVAADGRNSPLRNGCGITTREWQYPQTAIVLNFNHSLDHHDASTEFHTPTGPFTVVPLGHLKSSLVWVVKPEEAVQIAVMPGDQLEPLLEEKMGSFLGKVSIEGSVQRFALSGMVANRLGEGNLVLVGEAAHVFPPIGAQGFNLGVRDVEAVVSLTGQPAIGPGIGEQYHRKRFQDVNTRTASVDLLNRSLLSDFIPVQAARSFGLYTLGSFSPLRRLAMRQGVAPDLSDLSPFKAAAALFSRRNRPEPDTGRQ